MRKTPGFDSRLGPLGEPEEIRVGEGLGRLAKKLEEYESRLEKATDSKHYIDSLYKTAICRALIDGGYASKQEVKNKLEREYGPVDQTFDNAWNVILDYVTTGGRVNRGGTGLPEVED